jgi:hypothetical protein
LAGIQARSGNEVVLYFDWIGRRLMNSSGNRALSDSRNRRSGILFLALIQTCLLASGAHAQLSYIDQYASGTVEGMDCSGGPSSCHQGIFFHVPTSLRGVAS